MKKEFTVFGITIENISITFGVVLMFWGLMVTLISNSQSFTSLIPTILGLPITILSIFAKKFTDKKKMFYYLISSMLFIPSIIMYFNLTNLNLFKIILLLFRKLLYFLKHFYKYFSKYTVIKISLI